MTTSSAPLTRTYLHEFADFEGVAYLNTSLQGPLPLVSVRAAAEALEWKLRPHRLADAIYFELPDHIREKIARVIAADPSEIAVTTGASTGMGCVAAGIDWQPGDEVLVGRGEFPSHFSTWMRYQDAGKLRMRVVEPSGPFLTPEDYIAQIGPHTRVVSASLVRYDNGAMFDSAAVGRACERVDAALLLDLSQVAGAMKLSIRDLGATMAVCSGYKWLLGPYGSGFFWVANEWIDRLPLGSVYMQALEGAHNFNKMGRRELRAVPGARRWDAAETANFTNLSAWEASLDLLERIGVDAVQNYTDSLTLKIIQELARDRYQLVSPEQRERRGPYLCVSAINPNDNLAIYERLRAAQVHVSLRENALRISPYIYNSVADISRLLNVLNA
jgi:selenocysteine lyase/cysteine desulfurase